MNARKILWLHCIACLSLVFAACSALPTTLPTADSAPTLVSVLGAVYRQQPFYPSVLGPEWKFLTIDDYGPEGGCLNYDAPGAGQNRRITLILCANIRAGVYQPLDATQKFADSALALNALDLGELGSAAVWQKSESLLTASNMFVASLAVGADTLTVQANTDPLGSDSPQAYFDKNLAALFRRAYQRMFADAGLAQGGVFFKDDFSAPGNWVVASNATGSSAYEQDGFALGLAVDNQINVSVPNFASVQDVSVSAQARILAGGQNVFYGVVCRYQDANNYYMFRITNQGNYSIAKVVNNQVTNFGAVQWGYDPQTILTGDQVNTLRADCSGDTLTLFVNDHQIAQEIDSDLKTGGYGLVMGTLGTPAGKVWFGHFSAIVP